MRQATSNSARVLSKIALGLLFTSSALAADLYVSPNGSDSNSGSQSAPLRTIQRADQLATAGTTVHVAPGNYGGGFTTTKSGTSSARIVFVSDTKWGAKIVGTGGSTAESAWLTKGNYVDIVGFEIDGRTGAGLSWCTGLYVGGGNSTVRNNKVHDVCIDYNTFSKNSGGNGGAGIIVDGWWGGLNSSAIGNIVYNIGPSDRSSDLIHGIYQSTSGSVINNVIYNVVGDGITSWHDAHDINIINNTVYKSRGQGILVGAGDAGIGGGALSSRAGDYFNVFNNIVVGAAKYGIQEYGRTGSNNYFYNNLTYNNGYGNLSLLRGKQSGSISVDPRFANAAGADFHLQSGSPAINVGTSTSAPSTDVEGNARPAGGGYDLGAYEFASTSTSPTPAPAPATPSPTPAPAPAPSPSATPSASVTLLIGGDPATSAYSVEAKTNLTGALRVEFYDNGLLKATERSAPYCMTPESAGACTAAKLGTGTHNLVVKVFTDTGTTVLAQTSKTITEGGGTPMPTGFKYYAARHSGKCMDVTDASTANGALLQQWTCGDAPHKRFELVSMGNNQYSLRAQHSGKCLDVSGASTADGAKIQQYACTGSANQKFTLKDMGSGYYSLVAAHSGKCVDVSGISLNNGALLHQWTCNGATNQQFKIQ